MAYRVFSLHRVRVYVSTDGFDVGAFCIFVVFALFELRVFICFDVVYVSVGVYLYLLVVVADFVELFLWEVRGETFFHLLRIGFRFLYEQL